MTDFGKKINEKYGLFLAAADKFSECGWDKTFKSKTALTITNEFYSSVHKTYRKPCPIETDDRKNSN